MPLIITKRFKKAYQQLQQSTQNKIKKALRLLDDNPRPPSLRVKKIQGAGGRIYEARVDQKYRLSFELDGDNKILRNVDNHDECLKNP